MSTPNEFDYTPEDAMLDDMDCPDIDRGKLALLLDDEAEDQRADRDAADDMRMMVRASR